MDTRYHRGYHRENRYVTGLSIFLARGSVTGCNITGCNSYGITIGEPRKFTCGRERIIFSRGSGERSWRKGRVSGREESTKVITVLT